MAAPIIDWSGGGVPLGVVYATTARTDGALFRLRPAKECRPGERSLDDLYQWLADLALALLEDCRALP